MASVGRVERDALAVIGGGRWARVLASILAGSDLPFASVVIVSESAALAGAEENRGRFAGFAVLPSIEAAIGHFRLGGAIIANAARAHAATADKLVRAGIPVLIEKPAALALAEARHLLELGDAHGVCVVPSLSYLHTSYLRRFAALLRSKGTLRRVGVEWRDAAGEVRYGERKSYDAGISVAQDVMPHIWSILNLVIGFAADDLAGQDIEVKACQIAKGGSLAEYELEAGGVPSRVALERDAPARRRQVTAELASGDRLEIDFTVEPGTIASGDTQQSGDPQWTEGPRPLARQIGEFLAAGKGRTSAAARHAILGSVALAERCDILLKQRQREWARPERADPELHYACRDLLAGRFYEEGRGRPGDAQALDAWISHKLRLFRSAAPDTDAEVPWRADPDLLGGTKGEMNFSSSRRP